MEIPIEIPVETTKPKRRAVPPRFAAMTKAKETPAPKTEEPPKVESKPADGAEREEAVTSRTSPISSHSLPSRSGQFQPMFPGRGGGKSAFGMVPIYPS